MKHSNQPQLGDWLKTLGIAGGAVLGAGTIGQSVAAGLEPAGSSGGAEPSAQPRERRSSKVGNPLYVVINHEEQYSIWPAEVQPPRGWKAASRPGSLREAARRIDPEDRRSFQVVINHEEQYSIWPKDQAVPAGFEVRLRECQPLDCVRSLETLPQPRRPR